MMMAYSELKLQEFIEAPIIQLAKNDEPAINSKTTEIFVTSKLKSHGGNNELAMSTSSRILNN